MLANLFFIVSFNMALQLKYYEQHLEVDRPYLFAASDDIF